MCAAAAAAVCAGASARAATQAYWRFEDKNGSPAVAGDFLQSTPAGGGTVSGGNVVDVTSDSSGNGNVLRTFHSPNDPNSSDGVQRLETSPSYTLNTPGGIVPQTGAANLLSFDFDGAPGSDPPAPTDAGGDDIYSQGKENEAGAVNSINFTQYTVEGAFRVDTLGRFQSIVVKDGNVGNNAGANGGAGPLPPFNVKLFNNDTLNIETFDGSGAFRAIQADAPVASGQWYKFAVVNDGAALKMYLDSGGGYVLQSQQAAISGGALFANDANWAVGRGWFGGPNDSFDGQIDEVRISDIALAPTQFLFAVPEPAAMTTAAIALAGWLPFARRRRRAA
jgi:hypothetical protein